MEQVKRVIKKKYFDGVCYDCGKKGHISKDCLLRKGKDRKNEKAEQAFDGD